MEAHMRKGCTMACNSVRVRGTRVGQVCHHSRVRSVSSLTLFGQLGVGQRLQVGPDPLQLGCEESNLVGPEGAQVASRPPFGVIFSHFEPFWAVFDPFWPLGGGAKAPSGFGPPKVGVKWGGESKLVGPEGPSGVKTPLGAIFGVNFP